ncbi:hypothetical protein [Chroococcidiopsis sp. SAG 2025]|uniref:hypothetical protein n=1 Tax=Chroococcidiopsis sp. SAG 2025 TaxID=171389 RepID=UPI0029371A1D|nr:hypothetical protein [Chroococcidiopsis sp. SAG 2025]
MLVILYIIEPQKPPFWWFGLRERLLVYGRWSRQARFTLGIAMKTKKLRWGQADIDRFSLYDFPTRRSANRDTIINRNNFLR